PSHERSRQYRVGGLPVTQGNPLAGKGCGLGPGIVQLQRKITDLHLHPPGLHPLLVPDERHVGRDTEKLAQRCGHGVHESRNERTQRDCYAISVHRRVPPSVTPTVIGRFASTGSSTSPQNRLALTRAGTRTRETL